MGRRLTVRAETRPEGEDIGRGAIMLLIIEHDLHAAMSVSQDGSFAKTSMA